MNRATPLFLTTHHTARPRAWDPGHARRGLPRGAAQWACPTEPPPPPTYLSPGLAAVRHTHFCPHSEGHLVSTAGGLNPQSKLAGEQVATSQTKPEHSGPGPHCTAQGHPRAPTHGTTGHWPPDNWPGTRSHEQSRLWTGQEWTRGRPHVSPDSAPGGLGRPDLLPGGRVSSRSSAVTPFSRNRKHLRCPFLAVGPSDKPHRPGRPAHITVLDRNTSVLRPLD